MIAPGWRSNDCSSIDSATRSIAQFSNAARFHCNVPLRAGAMRHAWACGARSFRSRQLLLHRRFGGRLVGGMLVRIDGERDPVPPHVAPKALHRREGPFIVVEAGKHPTARVVDVGHQHTSRAAPLEPVMMGAIQLDQLPHRGLPRPPHPMWPLPPREMIDPSRPQPQGLVAERDPLLLRQLLRRQRRPKIGIPAP